MTCLRMRCDSDDGDLVFLRPVIPENSVSGWCGLLSVCLKNLFSPGAFQGRKFMSPKTGMPWIFGKEQKGLFYGLIPLGKSLVCLKPIELFPGLVGSEYLKQGPVL